MESDEMITKLEKSLLDFVCRVSDDKKIATPEEMEALPKVAEVLSKLILNH